MFANPYYIDHDLTFRPFRSSRNGLNLILSLGYVSDIPGVELLNAEECPLFYLTAAYVLPRIQPLYMLSKIPAPKRDSMLIPREIETKESGVHVALPDCVRNEGEAKKFLSSEAFHALMTTLIMQINKADLFGATFTTRLAAVEDCSLNPSFLANRSWFDPARYAYESYALDFAANPCWPGIYLIGNAGRTNAIPMPYTYAVSTTLYRDALLKAFDTVELRGNTAVGVSFAEGQKRDDLLTRESDFKVIKTAKRIQYQGMF